MPETTPPKGARFMKPFLTCELCRRTTSAERASLISAEREWFVGCTPCSTDRVYWIALNDLLGKHQSFGDDSIDGWIEHLSEKMWFRKDEFLAALDRAGIVRIP